MRGAAEDATTTRDILGEKSAKLSQKKGVLNLPVSGDEKVQRQLSISVACSMLNGPACMCCALCLFLYLSYTHLIECSFVVTFT